MKKSILVFLLLLASCSTQMTKQESLTLTGTLSATPSAPGLPSSTATLQPSLTASLIPIDTLITTLTIEPQPTETPIPFSKPVADSHSYWNYDISPYGEWIAWIGCCAEVESFPHLIVENLAGDKSWLVTLPEEQHNEICLTGCYLTPKFWSTDGNYLYFDTYPADMDMIISSDPAKSVMKLSLQSGIVSYVLPPRQDDFYHYAFSSAGEWLVFTLENEPLVTFTLVNLATEQSDSFTKSIQAQALGYIIWSPFDDWFVFHVYGFTEDEIFLVNIQDFSFRKIYAGEYPLDHYEWYSPTEIKLYPLDYGNQKPILINIQTGEITPIE